MVAGATRHGNHKGQDRGFEAAPDPAPGGGVPVLGGAHTRVPAHPLHHREAARRGAMRAAPAEALPFHEVTTYSFHSFIFAHETGIAYSS